MIAPASRQLAGDFGITNDVVIALTTSVFVLAYAIGPLFLGPMSELYGRSRVLQVANMWYLGKCHGLAKRELLNVHIFPQSGISGAVLHRTRGKLLPSASLQDWAVAHLLRYVSITTRSLTTSPVRPDSHMTCADWWRRPWRRLCSPRERSGHCNLFPRTSSRACRWPRSRCLDCGEEHLALGFLEYDVSGCCNSSSGPVCIARKFVFSLAYLTHTSADPGDTSVCSSTSRA
jgi:hypothetical protein